MEWGCPISIIIPVYNVRPFIVEALESVINQSYQNLEIIIIDDGSTDGSELICDEYSRKDKRVTVIHQDNEGLSAARNAGLEIMSGDVVAFLDSDDAYHQDFISLMFTSMINEKSDIVICQYLVQKTVGHMFRMRDKDEKAEPLLARGTIDRSYSLRSLVEGTLNPAVWNKLYRKELWKEIRFPEGHVYEDICTVFKVLDLSERVSILDHPLYMYRKRSGQITDAITPNNISDWLLSRNHLEQLISADTTKTFSEECLLSYYCSKINQMISFYIDLFSSGADEIFVENLERDIIRFGEEIGINNCDKSTHIEYWMICHCPWILRKTVLLYRWYMRFGRRDSS